MVAMGMIAVTASLGFGAKEGESGTVKLKYASGRPLTKAITPSWAKRANTFSIKPTGSTVKIGGSAVVAGARKSGATSQIGLDCNGDGKVSGREWHTIPKSGRASFSGKAGDKQFAVHLWDLRVYVNTKSGQLTDIYGRATICSGMKGFINSVPVYILDDDLDGEFSQSGSSRDAILIGSTPLAIPLRKQHKIGNNFYRLEVAADGTSITWTQLVDVSVGVVRTSFSSRALKGLVLVGEDSAYDVKACGSGGIPAGDYQLAFGVVGGKSLTVLRPGKSALTYPIQGEMINMLRIGAPLRVNFKATIVGRKVSVSAWMSILGAGNEVYGPFDYSSGGNARPKVTIVAGSKTVSNNTRMGYG